jgi:hypothetical protein
MYVPGEVVHGAHPEGGIPKQGGFGSVVFILSRNNANDRVFTNDPEVSTPQAVIDPENVNTSTYTIRQRYATHPIPQGALKQFGQTASVDIPLISDSGEMYDPEIDPGLGIAVINPGNDHSPHFMLTGISAIL